MHIPFERIHTNADTVVVFVHGFIGSPRQFDDMAEVAFNNGCSVLALLLPGHGGAASEFAKFRLSHWEAHIEGEIRRISRGYKNVVLAGHSIGGLMCLNAALDKGLNIKGVMSVSAPLKLCFSFRKLIFAARLYLLAKSGDMIVEAYRKTKGVSGAGLFEYVRWVGQGIDVFRLMAKTKANLPRVCVPTTIVHSEKDETASVKSVKIFKRRLINAQKRIIILIKSRHAFYFPNERAVVCRELTKLINRVRRSEDFN